MNDANIERLANKAPRFTVMSHAPLSKTGGCWTFTVVDRARGVVVHGPTTLSQEAAEYCGRFSSPVDVATMPHAAMQMELPQ